MAKNYFLPVLLFFIFFMSAFFIYQSQAMKRIYKAEVLKGLTRTEAIENIILTEKDIQHLPEPLQKYIHYVGVIGKEKVQNVKISFKGEMKLDPKQDWVKIKTEQYNFLDQPTRLFYIRASKLGIPFMGLDSFIAGKGNMLIKVVGLFTVADARGPEMDMGEMVTLFNDICLFSPAVLIDRRFQWETIDTFTVKGTFKYKTHKVSALLYFNKKGQLINFVTDDRFYSPMGKTYQRVRWSTPVRDYQEFNGIKVPTYGEGVWHFKTGDYCYAKFRLKEIKYNKR
jgi:hypothetical protein